MSTMGRILIGGLLWAAGAGLALAGPVAGCDGKEPEICTSTEDEDQDGRIGCNDDDCWVQGGVCPEVCDTIFDEDGDGVDGCDDSDCWLAGGPCPEECESDFDEDGDGNVACEDDDCWFEGGPCPEVCPVLGQADPDDEDGDGTTGCDDPDCWLPDGGCAERCDTEFDEDADGAVGCMDDDCLMDPFCVPSFQEDVQPVFLEHCWGQDGACHSDLSNLGGLSFDGYDDMPLPSNYCGSRVTKGACALFRILEPSMPQNCLGCVPQEDIDVIQAWVEGGIPR
jgi:hypothetical protein